MTTPELTVQVSREFESPVESLFNAWRDPAFITRWWKNLEVATLDFREGGAYRFEWKSWDGHVSGEYKTISENKEIVFSWMGVGKEKSDANESLVRILFDDLGGGRSKMTLTHSLNQSVDAYRSHQEGWINAVTDLAEEFTRKNGPISTTRTVSATVDEVFQWLTEDGRLEQWFFTKCRMAAPAKAEGEYRIDWESTSAPERNHFRHGKYLEAVPNKRLRFEWKGFSDPKLQDLTTVVTIELEPHGDGTRVHLSHAGWGENEVWTKERDGHEVGWNFYLDNLVSVVAGSGDQRASVFGQRVLTETERGSSKEGPVRTTA